MISRFTGRAVAVAAAMALMPVAGASAASLIRDAEIEATLRAYADPIFEAAGLDADAVQVHIVNDRHINAFVSGGLQMFMHTGLLTAAETPNEVIGVIAHETGHIAGGHLIRAEEAIENATNEMIVGALVSVAVGVLVEDPAPAIGGQQMARMIALRNLMTFTRAQEGAADQAAYRLLEATGQAPDGMVSFFKVLQRQEALSTERQDPYLRSHPLATSRIDAAEAAVARSAYAGKPDSAELKLRHQRMLAKLNGYLKPLRQVMKLYPQSDQSVPARYARAITLYRAARMDEAIAIMDGLIAEAPSDPFFLEQKAQILYENGRVAEAVPLYQRALDLAPGEPLIRLELAQAQIQLAEMAQGKGQSVDPALLRAAIDDLNKVVHLESKNAGVYKLLATAYGMQGDMAMADLFQAERWLASGDEKRGKQLAEQALAALPTGSPGWLRAQDIQFVADQREEDKLRFVPITCVYCNGQAALAP
jgi:predicted Zn-dependent protease